MKRHIFIIFSFFSLAIASANDIRTGLHFNAYLSLPEQRTTLNLENGEAIPLGKETVVSFDLWMRREKTVYGLVLRLISDKKETIDMVFSFHKPNDPYPAVVVDNETYPLSENTVYNKWIPVIIRLNRANDVILVSYGGNQVEIPYSFGNTGSFYASFGKCLQGDFTSDDVAPFNLKSVRIYDRKKEIRRWELDKYDGNTCYDLVKGIPAMAVNPQWLINEYCQWKEVYTKTVPDKFQCTFDEKNNILYIVPDEKSVICYHVAEGREQVIEVKSGYPATQNFSQLSVDTINNRLVSFKIDEGRISFFSFENQSWSLAKPVYPKSLFWHHTSVFSPNDTAVITFGGYGDYRYNNILAKFELNRVISGKKEISEIFPRYSAASCIVGDDLYIYGGRGSKSGKQELSTIYMYDLHKINLSTGVAEKVGNFQVENSTFLPAENMVYNDQDHCFYILTDAAEGSLVKLSLADSSAHFIGKSLPVAMSSLHLYRNLFYSPTLSKLLSVFDRNPKDGVKSICIYSMNYPPLLEAETLQPIPVVSHKYVYWLPGAIILILAVLFVLYRRRKRHDPVHEPFPTQEELLPAASTEPFMPEEPHYFDKSNHCICLLGGFCIRDKSGNDISGSFTPTLRELLLILILYTGRYQKGVLGAKLDELLWSDKPEDSARNNRYVSIRKLRLLLNRVGDIEIKSDNNYWSISYGQDVFCDYIQLMQYIHHSNLNNEQEFARFLEILLSGPLLPNTNSEWIDPFKSDLSNVVIDSLNEISQKENYGKTPKIMLRIADAILSHDVLNEEALRTKCRILFANGKKSIAKNVYDAFCKEYQALLDASFPQSFNAVVGDD